MKLDSEGIGRVIAKRRVPVLSIVLSDLVVNYTTDEVVLAGLLNDYRLLVHRLPLRPDCDYVLTTKSGSQFTTSER